MRNLYQDTFARLSLKIYYYSLLQKLVGSGKIFSSTVLAEFAFADLHVLILKFWILYCEKILVCKLIIGPNNDLNT